MTTTSTTAPAVKKQNTAAATTEVKTTDAKNVTVKNPTVPLDKILEGDIQRVDFGNMDELTESIDKHGLENPLKVYSDKKGNWIVCAGGGHRRLRALKSITKGGDFAFPEGIPVVIVEQESKTDMLISALINNDGKAYTMTEQAAIFEKLEKAEWSPAKIAAHTGKTTQHIRDCKTLASATPKTHDLILQGKISATNVIAMIRKAGDAKTAEANILELLDTSAKSKGKNKGKVTSSKVKEATSSKVKKDSAGVGSIKDRLNQCYELLELNDKDARYSEMNIIHLLQYIETGAGNLGKLLEGTITKKKKS